MMYMAAIKTHATDEPLDAFLERFAPSKHAIDDSYTICQMMEKATGATPVVWSNNMVALAPTNIKARSPLNGDFGPLLLSLPGNRP